MTRANRSLKVTVIGAGSATFSLGLVKDLCLTEHLKGSLVSFMDVDAGRLENITALAERYSKELGADLRDPAAAVADVFGKTRTREQQVPIIDALANGVGGLFQVNSR